MIVHFAVSLGRRESEAVKDRRYQVVVHLLRHGARSNAVDANAQKEAVENAITKYDNLKNGMAGFEDGPPANFTAMRLTDVPCYTRLMIDNATHLRFEQAHNGNGSTLDNFTLVKDWHKGQARQVWKSDDGGAESGETRDPSTAARTMAQ